TQIRLTPYNIKLSGAVTWGTMAKPPRVNASERPKGVVFSALLEQKPVPLVFLKTNEASIRLIVNADKKNDCALMFLI
ncbi:hypothetical protein, partial [Alteromonas sp. KUL17]|uniref:hypothetical protein n=1 Tax=Alteromonas sp. KUL17 TaxID=2480796 RepID=UPI001A93CA5D